MTTREQLEQEARELYPESYDAETGHHVDDWGFSECQREAHVRAKTITAEQVKKAARASYAATGSPLCWEVAGKPAKQEHRKRVRAAFRAAGFYVEGGER